MKDLKFVIGFIVLGGIIAYLTSGPLRVSDEEQAVVGTSLKSARVYARGTVTLESGLKDKAKDMAALFIIGRTLSGGPPIAAAKYDFPKFPFEFSLTLENNMVGDDFFDGDLNVTARLDKDGRAGPKQADDLEGSIVVKADGSRDIEIVIK